MTNDDTAFEMIILGAIGFTEETNFDDFCRALGKDCPKAGEKAEWAKLFKTIRSLAERRLLGAKWDQDNRFVAAQLTTAGRDRYREHLDKQRPLLR